MVSLIHQACFHRVFVNVTYLLSDPMLTLQINWMAVLLPKLMLGILLIAFAKIRK